MNENHAGMVEARRDAAAGDSPAILMGSPPARALSSAASRPGMLAVLRMLQPVRRLGAMGGAGLGMLIVSIVALMSAVLPAVHESQALQSQLASTQVGGMPASATATPRAFLSKLPARNDLPAILSTVVAQAQAAHLELHEGSYELIEGKGGAGPRYQMTLPVTGRYADVRKFVDGTLAAVPAAALDSISLSREDINSAVVAADLRFLVYLRGRP